MSGEWRAYAERTNLGRHIALNIGREIAPHKWDMVTEFSEAGALVTTVDEVDGQKMQDQLKIPDDIAESLYRALDRIYGQENPDGKIEALQAALEKEQARVDLIITRSLGAQQRPASAHRFSEGGVTS